MRCLRSSDGHVKQKEQRKANALLKQLWRGWNTKTVLYSNTLKGNCRSPVNFLVKELLNICKSFLHVFQIFSKKVNLPAAPAVASVRRFNSTEALYRSISLNKPRLVSSLALSPAACGSSPLSRSCQLSSEGQPPCGGRDAGLPAAASLHLTAAFTSEPATLSMFVKAHSAGAARFWIHSATGERVRGAMVQVGVWILLEAAAVDKAMAMVSGWDGVVAGVWKKSKGEPKISKK